MGKAALLVALVLAHTSSYEATKRAIEDKRQELAEQYRRAPSPARRRAILRAARKTALAAVVEEIAPAWMNTEWAMPGRSAQPGEGTIACGIFVGTVLQDAGFVLDRIAMGQLASEHIALSLTSRANLRRYSNRAASDVAAEVQAWGPGLYMLGLDYHAALVFVDEERNAWAIHSSYFAGRVIREPLQTEPGFASSRYRVLARLLDDRMMRKWLLGGRFVARAHRR